MSKRADPDAPATRDPAHRRPRVVIGLVGGLLDAEKQPGDRDHGWQPTLSLIEGLGASRCELLTIPRFTSVAAAVAEKGRARGCDVRVVELPPFNNWKLRETYEALRAYIREADLRPDREEYFIHCTTGSYVWQICLFLLTESRHLPGKLVITNPPGKGSPFEVWDLEAELYAPIRARFGDAERARATATLKLGIETRSEAYNAIVDCIAEVIEQSDDAILLTGETGTGKSHLARRIFEVKRATHRVSGELVEVNCATLRGDQAMSMLFGHKKGAFTGATTDRRGFLARADGGLLFLDEVGELGADEQTMLLLALEDHVFYPVGADTPVRSDFHLVCGTNRDLREDVRRGRFRADLLARIDLWTFRLPSLRERLVDLEPNLDYELDQQTRARGRPVGLSAEARRAWLDFATGPDAAWCGNFRDLSGSVRRMSTLARGGFVDRAGVEAEVQRLQEHWAGLLGEGGEGTRRWEHTPRVEALLGEGAAKLDLADRLQLEGVLNVCARHRHLAEAGPDRAPP